MIKFQSLTSFEQVGEGEYPPPHTHFCFLKFFAHTSNFIRETAIYIKMCFCRNFLDPLSLLHTLPFGLVWYANLGCSTVVQSFLCRSLPPPLYTPNSLFNSWDYTVLILLSILKRIFLIS